MHKIFPDIFSSGNTILKPHIILLLLVALAFANTLQNSFVFDDAWLIVNNPKIDIPLKELPSFFTTPMFKASGLTQAKEMYYRPITSLFYVLNYKIWGLNPAGYHLTGILIHLMSAIILYGTGLLLFDKNKLISLMAASIFAVHPITSEPMGVATAGDIIYGFFVITLIYFFLKERKYLSWFVFSLAMFSKEAAVLLPFALLILATGKKGLKKGAVEIAPYLVIIAVYLILRTMVVDAFLGKKMTQPLFTQMLTMAVATIDYIRLLFIPFPLNPYYPPRWFTSVFDPRVLTALALLSLISLLAFKLRKDRVMLFLLVFPFLMLAPAISMVNRFPMALGEYAYIGERHLYLPLMSFSLFITACIVKLAGEKRKKLVVIGWLFVITVLLTLTVSSNTTWKNNITRNAKILQAHPAAAFAHSDIGVAYVKQGHIDEAIKEHKTALKFDPDYAPAYYNLGVAYAEQGRIDEAVKEFKTAIRLMPSYANAHNNLGNVYAEQGYIDEAIKEYKTALKFDPDYARAYYNLGVTYAEQGRIDEAVKEYKTAIRLNPAYANAHNNLGSVYAEQGRIDEAISELKTAIALKPDFVAARNNLEILYEKKNSMKK